MAKPCKPGYKRGCVKSTTKKTSSKKKSTKKTARKACQTAKGKLKKGWRYGKNGRCIKAKAA